MGMHLQHVGGRCIYSVKPGSPIPQEDAQEVGEYIEKLETTVEITPHNLLDDARQDTSKLHPYFDWDNLVAGEKWRLQQARQILNHFEVVVVDLRKEEETKVRAWHSVFTTTDDVKAFEMESDNGADGDDEEPKSRRAYVNVMRVLDEPDLREQVIDNALREARAWQRRYSTYTELEPIFSAIEELAGENGH